MRNSEWAPVAGAGRMQGRVVGDEGGGTGRSRACGALRAFVVTLGFTPSEREALQGLEWSGART